MKFVLITSLYGSGETFLAKQLDGFLLDDMKEGIKRLKQSFELKTIIITDPTLCISKNRISAELILKELHPNCKMEWKFFENNPEKCLVNLKHRNDNRLISKFALYGLSKRYKIPKNAKPLEIWQP